MADTLPCPVMGCEWSVCREDVPSALRGRREWVEGEYRRRLDAHAGTHTSSQWYLAFSSLAATALELDHRLDKLEHGQVVHEARCGSWLLRDLDRCQHGSHLADRCWGCEDIDRNRGSRGNSLFRPGDVVGHGVHGEPYVVPGRLQDWGDATVWRQQP